MNVPHTIISKKPFYLFCTCDYLGWWRYFCYRPERMKVPPGVPGKNLMVETPHGQQYLFKLSLQYFYS